MRIAVRGSEDIAQVEVWESLSHTQARESITFKREPYQLHRVFVMMVITAGKDTQVEAMHAATTTWAVALAVGRGSTL